MRPVLSVLVLLACLGGGAALRAAEARTFPYEAVVTTETFVRSGQGKKFYPTGKLKVGERVLVHRHDPGAWFMVAPPAGSFNWIQAKLVNRNGDEGTVNTDGTSARVGSTFNDDRTVEQLPLNSGDMVKILEEKNLPTGKRGALETWLKIAPPRGQWRWVMGQHVVAASAYNPHVAPKSLAGDKRTPVPAEWKEIPPPTEDIAEDEEPSAREPLALPPSQVGQPTATQSPTEAQSPTAEAEHGPVARAPSLQTLDAELRGILALPKDEWDFAELRNRYQQARAANTFPASDRLFEQRLANVDRLAKDADIYREIIRITDETARRDDEILAKMEAAHAQFTAGMPMPVSPASSPTPTPMGAVPGPTGIPTAIGPAPTPVGPAPTAVAPAPAAPVPTPVGMQPTPMPAAATPTAATPQVANRFDGAGIVQRAPNGTQPSHLLIAPDGRVLAFLVSSGGVDMDVFVGREAGVRGNRSYRPELKTDLINVSSLVLVRLAR